MTRSSKSMNETACSLLYGKGNFTTIAVYGGQPFLWDKHWNRLISNSSMLDISLSKISERETHAALNGSIAKCRIANGRARITLYDESPSLLWSATKERRTTVSIIVAERRTISRNPRLFLSPRRVNSTSPLAGIKSCNYLEHLMAYEEARTRDFDEAIRLNEKGYVASACMANVFWESSGKLCTPSLSTGCLAGTTREFVLENLECEEVEARLEVLESADRIFLTSAGLGVTPIAEFNGRRLDTSDHPILQLIPD